MPKYHLVTIKFNQSITLTNKKSKTGKKIKN